MSNKSFDTALPDKGALPQRFFLRLVHWVKEEYRLTHYAHTRWKAEKGDAMAQYVLGTMCEAGHGLFQTSTEAVKWYQQAAFKGIAPAQLALALKFLSGDGVGQNDSEAFLWLRKAAEQGHPQAQYELAGLYSAGRGTPRDLIQAQRWYRKAADNGHAGAKQQFEQFRTTVLEAERREKVAA